MVNREIMTDRKAYHAKNCHNADSSFGFASHSAVSHDGIGPHEPIVQLQPASSGSDGKTYGTTDGRDKAHGVSKNKHILIF